MPQIHTHYDTLSVVRNAPPEVIRAAYKTLSQKYHPDRNSEDANATAIMAKINEAYAALSDPAKRKEYDKWLEKQESFSATQQDKPKPEPEKKTNQTKTPPPPPSPKSEGIFNRTLSALGVIAMIVGILIVKSCAHIAGKNIANTISKPSVQEIERTLTESLAKSVEIINKQAPTVVDKEIRLDRAASVGTSLTYFYSFSNYSSQNINSDVLQTEFKPQVIKNVCANEQMKPSLQYGATYVYVYSGNDGMEIFRFEVNNDVCNNLAVATPEPSPVSTEPPVIQNNPYIEPSQSAPVSPEPVPSVQQEVVTTNTDNCTGDCVNGKGTIVYANGNRYEGKFKNGYPNGYGTVIYANGDKYVGNFRKGVPVGKGTRFYGNGDKYIGRFRNGLPEGHGTVIFANGQNFSGKFKNGQPVYSNKPSHSQIREQVEVVREQAEEPQVREQAYEQVEEVPTQEQVEAEKIQARKLALDKKEAEIQAREQALNKAKERSPSTWDNDRYMQNREQQERRETFERLDRL